jgi:hypothetical protein
MKNKYVYLATILFLIVALKIDFDQHRWQQNRVFQYDTFGNHNYLPSFFLYNDISQYKFMDTIYNRYKPAGEGIKMYGLFKIEKTGKYCNKYPMGVSVFQMPLFLVAHLHNLITKQDASDGYSSPYQHSVVLSTLLFTVWGFILLTNFLLVYFNKKEVFITILLLSFATNLFHYATSESGFSHPYLFFIFCAVLYLTEKWYKVPNYKYSILIGICIGLSAITRPIDALVFLVPLFWDWKRISNLEFLKSNKYYILIAILFTFLTALPQMIYWKYITDSWIFFSYPGEQFEFGRFRVIQGLFSYRKGWFIYTPIAFLGFIALFKIPKDSVYYFYKKPILIFFIPMIYIVFSWHSWFYGWSFGCRSLIETLPLLAFPIAFLVKSIFNLKLFYRVASILGLSFLIYLNLFQTWQYTVGILPGNCINDIFYYKAFLKTENIPNKDGILKMQQLIDAENGY